MKPCPCGSYAINPHHHGRDPSADRDLCDVCYWRKRAVLSDEAVRLLASWCVAIEDQGTGWDNWDKFYKDASFRPGPLRELIDAEKVRIRLQDS